MPEKTPHIPRPDDTRLDAFLTALAAWEIKHAKWVLVVTFVLLFLSLWPASNLKLSLNEDVFSPTLGVDAKDHRHTIQRVGGADFLVGIVEGGKLDDRKRFVNAWTKRLEMDQARRLERQEDPWLRYTLYRLPVHFFEDRRLLYLELDDLRDIEDRLERRLDQEKKKKNPFYVDLEDETEPEVDISFEDLQDKYGIKRFREYSVTDDGQIVAILFKPTLPGSDVDFSVQFVKWVRETGDELLITGSYPDIHFSMGGTYDQHTFSPSSVVQHGLPTVLFVLFCFAFLTLIAFRYIKMAALVFFSMGVAIVWIIATAALVVGEINLVSALSIPVTLGFGAVWCVLFLLRYLKERRRNLDVSEAFSTTLVAEGRQAILVGLALFISFAFFAVLDIQELTHLGILSAFNIFIILLIVLFVLPSSLFISESLYLSVVHQVVVIGRSLPQRLPRGPVFILFGGLFTLAGLFVFFQSMPCWTEPWCSARARCCENAPCCRPYLDFEFDLSELQRRMPRLDEIRHKFNMAAHLPLKPLMVLAPNRDTLNHYLKEVTEKQLTARHLQATSSIFTFLPDDQREKQLVLNRIDRLATEENINFLDQKIQRRIEDVQPILHPEIITLYQLPLSIIRTFTQQPPGTTGLLPILKEAFANNNGPLSASEWQSLLSGAISRIPPETQDRQLKQAQQYGFHQSIPQDIHTLDKKSKHAYLLEILTRFHEECVGTLAYHYPAENPMFGQAALGLARSIKTIIQKPAYKHVIVVGYSVAIAETFHRVMTVLPLSTFFSLLSLVLLFVCVFKRPGISLSGLIPLAISMMILTVGMAIFQIRWNIYNIAVLPVLFGLSLDASLRVYFQYWASKQIGSVICLQSLVRPLLFLTLSQLFTYLGILFMDHEGISSAGRLAFAGTLISLLAAITTYPALLEFFHRRIRNW